MKETKKYTVTIEIQDEFIDYKTEPGVFSIHELIGVIAITVGDIVGIAQQTGVTGVTSIVKEILDKPLRSFLSLKEETFNANTNTTRHNN